MSKLTIPPELECVEDGRFSYVHLKKLEGETMPIIVARDIQPEYARLFAAAPELLAACKAALERLERVDDRDVMEQLETAIAKAEGRQ